MVVECLILRESRYCISLGTSLYAVRLDEGVWKLLVGENARSGVCGLDCKEGHDTID